LFGYSAHNNAQHQRYYIGNIWSFLAIFGDLNELKLSKMLEKWQKKV
jgi:hypothetical protein